MHEKKSNGKKIAAIIIAILVLVVAGGGIWYGVQANNNRVQAEQAAKKKAAAASSAKKKATAESSSAAAASSQAAADPLFGKLKQYGLTYPELQYAKTMPVTFVGDSVMLGSESFLKEIFPKMTMAADVSRQAYGVPAVLKKLNSENKLADTVVLGVGTNGTFTADTTKEIMDVLGSKRDVFWINVHVPSQPWEAQSNAQIKNAAEKYKNVHLIDWYTEAKNHTDWFAADGFHPSTAGQPHYYTLVAKQVLQQAAK
ncbi:SGNH/GDSL hydrolase family protein [Schleiferilactobacillus harbinensis]|uniref:Acyltransferase n=1 Tax=Schleiferilactobacillus harbinensis TaxID=304207 RepID=A0A5P8M8L9_9LACO|nr:acyltransferase [Schleiferilactobacillus harbinensis]QFR24779.1 acyltransferase [Schleiferilactobacillus harbinensis]